MYDTQSCHISFNNTQQDNHVRSPLGYSRPTLSELSIEEFKKWNNRLWKTLQVVLHDTYVDIWGYAHKRMLCALHKIIFMALPWLTDWPWNTLYGSFSCTSKAAARIRPCLRAAARESSSTRPPLAVFTKNAPVKKNPSLRGRRLLCT